MRRSPEVAVTPVTSCVASMPPGGRPKRMGDPKVLPDRDPPCRPRLLRRGASPR